MARAPGIVFQTQSPAAGGELPRMDVAAFVGFAAAGPLDTPVPVEDPVQFQAIFGPDLCLCWNEASGHHHLNYLGACVRSFFRNGGHRCWVVRVADEPVSNRFFLPNLIAVDPTGAADGFRAALLRARSEGSWSDDLRIGTEVQRTLFAGCHFSREDDPGPLVQRSYVDAPWRLRTSIWRGDLLQVRFAAAVLFLAVERLEPVPPPVPPDLLRGLRASGREFWFAPSDPMPAGTGADRPQAVLVRWRRPQPSVPAAGFADSGFEPVAEGPGFWWPGAGEEPPELYLPLDPLLRAGMLLELAFAGGGVALAQLSDDAEPAGEVERERYGADPSDVIMVVRVRDLLWPLSVAAGQERAAKATGAPVIERLNLDIWAEDADGRQWRLDKLGLTGWHPRSPGNLPTDVMLYEQPENRPPLRDGLLPGEQLWPLVREPRFPLAGEAVGSPQIFLPLALEPVADAENRLTRRLPDPRPALERNGLADFNPRRLFLDPDLADESAAGLPEKAMAKRHLFLQKLTRVHTLWSLEEVTLFACPDLAHPGWAPEPRRQYVEVPRLEPPQPLPEGGCRLQWRLQQIPYQDAGMAVAVVAPEAAAGRYYRVERAGDPAFRHGVSAWRVQDLSLTVPAGAWPQAWYFRLRLDAQDASATWSNTVSLVLPRPDFVDAEPPPPAPELFSSRQGAGWAELVWQVPETVREPVFVLEMSVDPQLEAARVLYRGPDLHRVVWWAGEVPGYYRVRCVQGGRAGPWSNVWILARAPEPRWRLSPLPTDEPAIQERLLLHRAMLRLCLARGDLVCFGTLPVQYRDQEIVAYARRLTELLGDQEEAALGYGTVYHPWLLTQELTGEPRLLPSAGAMIGQFAAATLRRGAWIAPINQDLTGVVGLQTRPYGKRAGKLTDANLNLVEQEAMGFRAMTAFSLSSTPALRPLTIRRLFSLLRRYILQQGEIMAFAPNIPAFRALAQQRFYRMLFDLHMQGAFAGNTPEESFLVRADEELNPPESVEQGRFVMELRIAPAQPLSFITVRLVQTLGEQLKVTGV